MRLWSARCDARSSSWSIGVRCSSAIGLWSHSRQRTGSRSRNRLTLSSSQLHQRLRAIAARRWCTGATNCPTARASLTIGATCAPAAASRRHVGVAEGARFRRLHHEHALQHATVHHRHAEEGAERILSRVLEVLEPRMRGRVVHDHGPHLLGDEADEPFGEPHAYAAHALGPQPDRGREHEIRAIGLEQVDGAHVGREPALNQVDDVGERLGRVAAARDEIAELVERPEKR